MCSCLLVHKARECEEEEWEHTHKKHKLNVKILLIRKIFWKHIPHYELFHIPWDRGTKKREKWLCQMITVQHTHPGEEEREREMLQRFSCKPPLKHVIALLGAVLWCSVSSTLNKINDINSPHLCNWSTMYKYIFIWRISWVNKAKFSMP